MTPPLPQRKMTVQHCRHLTYQFFASARRGVTLIEAVLFIAVALGLIVGGLVFYQQASLAARTQETVRLFSAIVQETRALYLGEPLQEFAGENTTWNIPASQFQSVLISAQAVPPSAVKSSNMMQTPWGGDLKVHVFTSDGVPVVVINASGIPKEACVRLLSAFDLTDQESARDTIVGGQVAYSASNAIADGMVGVGVRAGEGGYQTRTLSPAQAALGCTYGVSNEVGLRMGNTVISSGSPLLPSVVSIRVGFTL